MHIKTVPQIKDELPEFSIGGAGQLNAQYFGDFLSHHFYLSARGVTFTFIIKCYKMLSYRRETALQGVL